MSRYHVLWACVAAGLALHAIGLGWDVWMHANDPTLAAREGIFTLENPSHLFIIAGVAIASTSVIAIAVLWLNERQFGGSSAAAATLRISTLPAIGLVAAGSIWLASLSEQPHDHMDGSHAHDGSTLVAHSHQLALDPGLRRALAAIGGDLVSATDHPHTDGTSDSGQQTIAAEAEQGGPQHAHAEIDISPEALTAASGFYEASMAAAPMWQDIRAALGGGYIQVTQDLPGIAAHFYNPTYNSDGIQLDPTRPEVLLYTKRLDGSWRFIGYQFTTEGFPEVAPQHFGALDAWHFHENLCFTAGGRVSVQPNEAACPGVFQPRTNWMLHVWTEPGATGVFAHDFAPITPGPFPPASRPAAEEVSIVRNP